MISKRAELSTQQIVLLIVLISSFAIILFFLVRLNLGGQSVKEVCHNSVVENSLPSSSSKTLKCSRNYVCITADGSCEGMLNPKRYKVKSVDEIYKVFADEMADCWWMFGEGKVNYVGGKPLKHNYCSICSQVLLDDSLKNIKKGDSHELELLKDGNISKDNLYNYLSNNNVSKKQTYAQYLFGTNDIQGLKAEILKNESARGVGTFGTMNVGKEHQQFVVMGIVSEQGWFYKAAGVGIVAVGIFTPVGWIASAIIIGAGVGTVAGGANLAGSFEPEIAALMVRGDGIKNQFMAPTIQEADSTKFKSLNCYDLITYG